MKNFFLFLFDFLCRFNLMRKFFYFLILLNNPYFRYRLTDRIFLNISEEEKNFLRQKIFDTYNKYYFRSITKNKDYNNLNNFKLDSHKQVDDLIKNNLDALFIQIGSCTGREIYNFKKKYPSLNCISTDLEKKFLKYQKKKYGNIFSYELLNIKYIDQFVINQKISNKKKNNICKWHF